MIYRWLPLHGRRHCYSSPTSACCCLSKAFIYPGKYTELYILSVLLNAYCCVFALALPHGIDAQRSRSSVLVSPPRPRPLCWALVRNGLFVVSICLTSTVGLFPLCSEHLHFSHSSHALIDHFFLEINNMLCFYYTIICYI